MSRRATIRLPSAMRLALTLSALFVVLALVAGAIAWTVMGDELRQRLFDDARTEAQALAAELQTGGAEELVRQIRIASSYGDSHGTLYFFQPTGSDQAIGNIQPSAVFEGPRELLAGRDFASLPEPGSQDGESYFAWGLRAPGGWIIVGRNSQWITDSQEVLIQSIAWGLGVALLATVLMALAIGRRDAQRVAGLNAVLAAVAGGDLTARFPDVGPSGDDLAQVAGGLNRMLEKLERNVDRLTQVSADIAHDLRSPLTKLRLRLEPLALRDDLPPEAHDAIAASLDSLDGISVAFDAILQLSQLETGNLRLETSHTDLSQIGQDVVEMLTPVAEESGHVLELGRPAAPVMADVNSELVTQALVNLVDNALRHTPEGARIRVDLEYNTGETRLCVSDNGPGIPPGELGKVTRRFYRLDRSRNRPGTGLGLSLVSAIATLHGGRLELSDNVPGLRACLVLPT
ncbi:MAG TPA: HAMP domain-containing protein [Rhodobacterales bacterium]|nr:HAMP domain-containing protein [Rhodobacterales bacterium]